MMVEPVSYTPIGFLHSSHQAAEETPIQPAYAPDCEGRLVVFPEYVEGLRDLDGFSHMYLIYHFHRAQPVKLIVKPFLQNVEHGVFSTRAPVRPNPIGLSIVRLVRIEGNILHLRGVDILDGTPVLDIKPYTDKFDHVKTLQNGWQDDVDGATAQVRGRRKFRGGGTS